MPSRLVRRRRAGNIVVLTCIFMIAAIGFLSLCLDLGYLTMAKTELQRTADSAAIAATWKLLDNGGINASENLAVAEEQSRSCALNFVQLNRVTGLSANLAVDDVVFGRLQNPSNPLEPLQLSGFVFPNAVQVRVRRSAAQNGEVSLFFARALGLNSLPEEAVATAAYLDRIAGFKSPPSGCTLGILPIALDQETWNLLLQGGGTDDWTWDSVQKCVRPGPDGIREINLYPQGTDAPGNRGTVDIGSSNNSTADIARQIVYGVNAEDLAALGGELRFDAEGKIYLNGDTGISAGVKDELVSIKGKPRVVPLFSNVEGPGNNATYTIVKFIGIRIMDVKLTGSASSKHVTIQPAIVKIRDTIPSDSADTSDFVYSPIWLVR